MEKLFEEFKTKIYQILSKNSSLHITEEDDSELYRLLFDFHSQSYWEGYFKRDAQERDLIGHPKTSANLNETNE